MNQALMLATERLLIRPIERGDRGPLHDAIFSDPELMGTGIYLGRALTVAQSRVFVDGLCRPRTDPRYIAPSVVFLKSSGDLIGYGGLTTETNWADHYQTTPEHLDAELFYVLTKSYWGQGLATELAQAVIHDAFAHRGVDRVWAGIRATNVASQRVAQKAGLHLAHEVTEDEQRVYLYERVRPEP